MGQPHDPAAEGPIAQAEAVAEEISSADRPMGTLGRRFNWRSPFFVGMAATAGVAVTVAVIYLFLTAGSVIVLIGLALFLAVGMEPAVSWLVRHK
ncbi:MAG: AI-2E family transporter, partial [Nakamurella sp.]